MSTKLKASRYLALSAATLKQRAGDLFRAAPWAFCVFVLTLPLTLLLPHLSLVATGFLLVGVINVLALARISVAWHRDILSDGRSGRAGWRLDRAEWKYFALLALFIAVVLAVVYATSRVPILIYFSLNRGGDTVFFISLFLALAAIWGPVLYLAATFAQSLPRVAVSGTYEFLRVRRASRVSAWPLMSMLFLLAVFLAFTGGYLSVGVSKMSATAIALGILGILVCTAQVMMTTAMCAVAYRESTVNVASAGS
ncbi:MAG: hypothetical protein ACREX5_18070 [Achromobacter pestifer]